MGCADAAGDLGLVPALLAQADCHAEALASGGYSALTANGGLISLLIAGVLGLYVAFCGWRMLLGQPPHLGAWTLALVKIGFVLALTSQWPVYQKLVYDTATHGPEEVAETLLGGYRSQSGEAPASRAAVQRTYLALVNAGLQGQSQVQASDAGPAPGNPTQVAAPASPPASLAATEFAAAAWLLLMSSAGIMVAAKLLTAMILALGPLAILLVMFEPTRGITVGWGRALIGLALTLLTAEVLAAIEISLLRPVLRNLDPMIVTAPAAGAQGGAALAVTSVCALTLVLGVGAVWVIALGLRLGPRPRFGDQGVAAAAAAAVARGAGSEVVSAGRPPGPAVTGAAAARRDLRVVADQGAARLRNLAGSSRAAESGEAASKLEPGTLLRRSARPKVSAAVDRRNR